jgi:hypothetical protein
MIREGVSPSKPEARSRRSYRPSTLAVDSTSEHPQPNDPGLLWAAALQARLLAEERKLLALLAALPGADRAGLADETELPEYLDPELMQAAAEPVQKG